MLILILILIPILILMLIPILLILALEEFYKSSGAVPKESWEFVQTKTEGDVDLP